MIARAECDDMTLHSRYLCFYTRSGDVTVVSSRSGDVTVVASRSDDVAAAASRSGHVTLVATRDDDAVT